MKWHLSQGLEEEQEKRRASKRALKRLKKEKLLVLLEGFKVEIFCAFIHSINCKGHYFLELIQSWTCELARGNKEEK